jgi:hypothetical protein
MNHIFDHLQRALECERLAAACEDRIARQALLESARSWRLLAETEPLVEAFDRAPRPESRRP